LQIRLALPTRRHRFVNNEMAVGHADMPTRRHQKYFVNIQPNPLERQSMNERTVEKHDEKQYKRSN